MGRAGAEQRAAQAARCGTKPEEGVCTTAAPGNGVPELASTTALATSLGEARCRLSSHGKPFRTLVGRLSQKELEYKYYRLHEPHSLCLHVSTLPCTAKAWSTHLEWPGGGREPTPASEPSEFQNLKSKQNLNVKAAGAQKPDLVGLRDPTPASLSPSPVPTQAWAPLISGTTRTGQLLGVLSEQ